MKPGRRDVAWANSVRVPNSDGGFSFSRPVRVQSDHGGPSSIGAPNLEVTSSLLFELASSIDVDLSFYSQQAFGGFCTSATAKQKSECKR